MHKQSVYDPFFSTDSSKKIASQKLTFRFSFFPVSEQVISAQKQPAAKIQRKSQTSDSPGTK